jgi:hypothetical protein
MHHYSTIVQNQINSNLRFLKEFKHGNLFSEDLIVQGQKSIGVNYNIDSAYVITYEIIYFNSLECSERTISLEEIDELFILTVEEYVDYLQNTLYSDEAGLDAYGHWYVATGDNGWMGFHDGQYVISAYGFMRPDEIMNELCHEQVTNHSNDRKSYDRDT